MKTLFVLFGATGDLAKRKIFPALIEFTKESQIDIFAIGRKNISTKEFIKNHLEGKLEGFLEYFSLENTPEELEQLIKKTEKYDEVIFYLSTPPKAFYEIMEGFSRLNLRDKKYKVVFEKPFGENLESFKKLNEKVLKNFEENQIYRTDHYLMKEGVMEILKFRKNSEYEKYWNSKFIKNIKVIAKENIGIGKRAEYYEEMGAIKDMIQSHLLQMVSLILMDLSSNNREEKIKVLENLKVKENAIVGQYESYKEEENVRKASKTETFALLNLELNSPRWKDTEISLITGKKMDKKETKIIVEFFEKEDLPKKIIFEIYPEEKICFEGNSVYCKYKKLEIKEAYKNILYGILKEKKEFFPSARGLEASWKIVDKIKINELIIYKDESSEEEILKQAKLQKIY